MNGQDDDNDGEGLSGFGWFMFLLGCVGVAGFVLTLAGMGG